MHGPTLSRDYLRGLVDATEKSASIAEEAYARGGPAKDSLPALPEMAAVAAGGEDANGLMRSDSLPYSTLWCGQYCVCACMHVVHVVRVHAYVIGVRDLDATTPNRKQAVSASAQNAQPESQ